MDVLERIKEQVENNKVIIYMKGTPDAAMWFFKQNS